MDPKIESFLNNVNDLTDGRLAADYPPPDYILIGECPDCLVIPRLCATDEEFERLVAEQTKPPAPEDSSPNAD